MREYNPLRRRRLVLVHALTIFVGAFLLFLVQPLIGKYILPWFGGTSAVWTTCMLFFQVLLLGGYLYAHLLQHFLRPARQAWLHIALLAAAACTLPIIPDEAWKPAPADEPTARILLLLALTVGFPYLLLASTGPLLQRWFSRVTSGRSPYRLYALSNVGSLLALFSYPVLFERAFQLPLQAWLWSGGFLLFAVLCAACAWLQTRVPPDAEPASAAGAGEAVTGGLAARPGVADILIWLALAACGSLMLLAVTNQLCQDVAVVPFLWLLPLGLYLITFIIAFDSERWYSRRVFSALLIFGIAGACVALGKGIGLSLIGQVALLSFALFACCMSLHGELARAKPHPRYLTLFYVAVSLGGALGGVFVAIVAPLIFDGFLELPLGLVATGVLVLLVVARQAWPAARAEPPATRVVMAVAGALVAAAVLGLAFVLYGLTRTEGNVIYKERNFYGVVRVSEWGEDVGWSQRRELVHGRILHGMQFQEVGMRDWATTYFAADSGVGMAIEQHPARETPGRPLRVGVIGLGAGTIAAYAGEDVDIAFYEINPLVIDIAETYFTFLSDARDRGGEVELLLGDARLVMERQLEEGRPMELDVLAVDAFSSDSIPVHLLTRECFAIYERHLGPDGILAIHISNRYLDLKPVVRGLAEAGGYEAIFVQGLGDSDFGIDSSDWVLLSRDPGLLQPIAEVPGVVPLESVAPTTVLWTDRFSNLFDILY